MQETIKIIRQFAKALLLASISSLWCFADDIVTINPISPSCYDSNDGKLQIIVNQDKIPIVIEIYNDSTLKESFVRLILKEKETYINNLIANNYYIKYAYNDISDTVHIQVEQPNRLEPGIITIEKGLNKPDDTNAILIASPEGGTKPYTYEWSKNTGDQKTEKAFNLGQGTYFCEINDANNCGPVKATIFFNQFIYPEFVNKK